jgi:hypothetical protein
MNKSFKTGRTKGSPRLEEGIYMGEWVSINGIYLTTHKDFGKAIKGSREFITPFTQSLNEAEPSQDTTKSAAPKTLCSPEPVNCHCPQ